MKLSASSEILLERYLLAVERRLPWQGRKDMIAEIRSNLLDSLEDGSGTEEILEEAQLEEALRKLGSPASVASAYYASDALIGPQHNIIFRLVVQYIAPIVVAVVFFAGILSFAISGGKSPFWSLWELLGNAWQVGIGIIGTTALILMVLTRFFPQVNQEKEAMELLAEKRKDWQVSNLPELVQKEDKVKLWEPALGIVFGSLWLVFWIFLFKQYGGFWWFADEQWRMVPIFTPNFTHFIPWIAVNTGLHILLNALYIVQARRTLPARVFEILITISDLTLVSSLLRTRNLVQFDQASALAQGFPADAISGIQLMLENNLEHWFLVFLVVVVSLALFGSLIGLIKSILRKR